MKASRIVALVIGCFVALIGAALLVGVAFGAGWTDHERQRVTAAEAVGRLVLPDDLAVPILDPEDGVGNGARAEVREARARRGGEAPRDRAEAPGRRGNHRLPQRREIDALLRQLPASEIRGEVLDPEEQRGAILHQRRELEEGDPPIACPSILLLVEGDLGVLLKARFALAAEHPDHNTDERGDEERPRPLDAVRLAGMESGAAARAGNGDDPCARS